MSYNFINRYYCFFRHLYVETYVEKDVTELLRVKDTRQFKQFIKLCANRAGHLLNINALSNEADYCI